MLLNDVLTYVGSLVVILWGAAHIAPTRSVVAGFEPLTEDNRRVLTMEWVAEGMTLIFLGVLVAAVTYLGGAGTTVGEGVYAVTAGMLFVMGAWTGVTGGRTPVAFFKVCPLVKSTAAVLFILAILL